MAQDCVQSMESGSETPGCRFLDGNGFCYAYNSAQMWCANGGDPTYCHDGGADWAQPLLGTATSQQTGWAPGTFPYRGSSADLGSLECACMKGCGCTTSWSGEQCYCADKTQQPVGPGNMSPKTVTYSSIQKDNCACRCNNVEGGRRRLLTIGSAPTVSLADMLSERGDVTSELSSVWRVNGAAARRLLGECDCTKCPTLQAPPVSTKTVDPLQTSIQMVPCPAGKTGPDNGPCQDCPAGTFKARCATIWSFGVCC